MLTTNFSPIMRFMLEDLDLLSRNRISNISSSVSSAGEIITLAVMVGILKNKRRQGAEKNTKAFSVHTAFSGGVWCMSSIISSPLELVPSVLCSALIHCEQRWPGLSCPRGMILCTVGLTQAYVALRECMRLKQTFCIFSWETVGIPRFYYVWVFLGPGRL